MYPRLGMWLIAMTLLAGASTPLQAERPKTSTGSTYGTVQVEGKARRYLIHTPAHLPPHRKAPLVLVFHGSGDDAAGMERLTKFSALADREGFLAVYPEALDHRWNDGRRSSESLEDVAFVRELIRLMEQKYHADPARIYATGFSNGAIFCHLLAAHLAGQISAIAPVSGGIAEPIAEGFKPGRPVSLFAIHGTNDPLVPFRGGPVDHGFGGRTLSTSDTLRRWIAVDGCGDHSKVGDLPDLDPEDHCWVQWRRWTSRRNRAEVLLYEVQGGGHTWPSGRQYAPVFFIGWTCGDFDATRTIWQFFKKHSLLE